MWLLLKKNIPENSNKEEKSTFCPFCLHFKNIYFKEHFTERFLENLKLLFYLHCYNFFLFVVFLRMWKPISTKYTFWDFRQTCQRKRPIHMTLHILLYICGLCAKKTMYMNSSGVWICELNVWICCTYFWILMVISWIHCVHVLEVMILSSLNMCLINCKRKLSG